MTNEMDANVQAAFKVADEILSRLLNHRQFTDGEIHYLIKQMEEKRRQDQLTEKLLSSYANVTDFKENLFDQMHQLSSMAKDAQGNSIRPLDDAVTELIRCTEKILEMERDEEKTRQDILEQRREVRRQEWLHRMKDVKQQIESIDQSYETKKQELRQFYEDLERKLHIT